MKSKESESASWKTKLYEVIFEAETPGGKLFDVLLLWSILLSVTAVILESVSSIRASYGPLLRAIEWAFTLLFTLEYALRIMAVKKPREYIFSYFGLVDLLSILPTYISLFIQGTQSLLVIRGLRLLRVFRILKFVRYVSAANTLMIALRGSRQKITVFLGGVLTLVLIAGTAMYLIEGETHRFSNIPLSIYWAIVTTTTVGYGDIYPQTVFGRVLASVLMILGYAIIAVPTGIVSVELAQQAAAQMNPEACPGCGRQGHAGDAVYCRHCGTKI